MDDAHSIVAAGDTRHSEHKAWLLALGEATYTASRVAGVTFDILRIFGDVDSSEMYGDPLGRLLNRLLMLRKSHPELPKINEFIESLLVAKQTRNDVLHALPVKDGLHRRLSENTSYIRDFYTVDDLRQATNELDVAWKMGSSLLYHDGGSAVQAWYNRS